MKKFALSMLAAMLLLTFVCSSALAITGDMTTKEAAAYSDPEMKHYIGTIPKFTSVLVRAYGSYANVYYKGASCFVKPSTLTQGEYDYNFIGIATLKGGSRVYQSATSASASRVTHSSRRVLVYAATNGYALIRTKVGGVFGFVSASNLTNFSA